jgi:hypothetical protein
MRRPFLFAVGIGIVIAASALDKSDRFNAVDRPVVNGNSDFGQIDVANLTTEQRALLRARYRYWPAADHRAPKSPL